MEYTKIRSINEYKSVSITPMKYPDELFEMYSVPIYETGHPEYLRGNEIGSSKVIVKKNDILLCKINPRINRVWVVADESEHKNIASSEWIVIRTSCHNPEFLAWYFRSPRFKQLMTSELTGIGGSLTRAQPKSVAEYPVPLIERERQDEIVNVLNRISFVIKQHKEELSTLDEFVKARFVEMFGDQFKGSMIKVGDIADVYIGLTYKPENVSEKGTIVLRSGNIQNQSLQVENDVVRVSGVKIADNKYVKDKDILMCARNGSARLVGKSCLIRNPKEEMAFGAFMSVIRTEYPYFLQGFFSSDYFKNQLTNVGTTSVNQITSKMLNNYNVIMPTKGQEEEFSVFCSQVDKSKVIVQKALDEAQLLFNSLMQQYFG